MTLVNDARTAYSDMHKQMNIPDGFGVRQAVWTSAVYAGNEHGFDGYKNTLEQGMAKLNAQTNVHAQSALKSRMLADLAVLSHFSKANEADVKAALAENGDGAFKAFGELYDKKKSQSSIYEHRLGSILR